MMRQSDDAMAMKRFSIASSSLLYRVSAPSRYIDFFALALFAQEWDSVIVVSNAFYFNLLIPFMFDGKILK